MVEHFEYPPNTVEITPGVYIVRSEIEKVLVSKVDILHKGIKQPLIKVEFQLKNSSPMALWFETKYIEEVDLLAAKLGSVLTKGATYQEFNYDS